MNAITVPVTPEHIRQAKPDHHRTCPLAIATAQALGLPPGSVSVTRREIEITEAAGQKTAYQPDWSVRNFIENYDDGQLTPWESHELQLRETKEGRRQAFLYLSD